MSESAVTRFTPSPRALLEFVALALVGLVLAGYVPANLTLQWDLRCYALAARAALAGLDPYRLESLSAVAGRPWGLPFLYPPVTLPLFLPMARLPWGALAVAWMTAKLAALVALGGIWWRGFRIGAMPLVVVLVLLFGFDGAALIDLRTGNIAIFEALLVWTALLAWAHGRTTAFTAGIVAAALFKLWPLAFLALLLVPAPGRRARPALLLAAAAAFVLTLVLPATLGPAAAWQALAAPLHAARPAGADDPGAVTLIAACVPGAGAMRLAMAVYAIAVAALGVVWWRRSAAGWGAGERASAAAWLWMLLAPRPMGYGYVMAIGPVLGLAPRPFRGRAGELALAAMLSVQAWLRLSGQPPFGLAQEQLPFLMLFGLWLLKVREDLASRRTPRTTAAAPERRAAA